MKVARQTQATTAMLRAEHDTQIDDLLADDYNLQLRLENAELENEKLIQFFGNLAIRNQKLTIYKIDNLRSLEQLSRNEKQTNQDDVDRRVVIDWSGEAEALLIASDKDNVTLSFFWKVFRVTKERCVIH
jgi:hypothetical protein